MQDQILQQALQSHQAGHLAEAEILYGHVLAADGRHYPALHLMGLMRFQQGRQPEALDYMERALAVRPGAPDTLVNYGIALAMAGRESEALPVLRQASVALPQSSGVHANLGAVLHRLDRHLEALAALDQALALKADDAAALTNRGLVLSALGCFEDAVVTFGAALAAAPAGLAALNGRGLALRALNRHGASLQDFEQMLRLASGHTAAQINRASALWSLGRIDEALAGYDTVLAQDPDQVEALASRANLLWTRKMALAPALADTARLATLAPEQPGVLGDLLHLKMYAGDWTDFEADKAALDAGVRAGKPVVEPFVYQGLSDSPADMLACAQIHTARKCPAQPPLRLGAARKPGKIRIGYVSGEFRAQATAYLMAGLYEDHDRSRFEVIGFDNTRKEQSPTRARLEAGFDRMIDITALSDADAARRIVAEGIDILVNLNGWFGAMRMSVFAQRPAPVQVNYLGFPGSLGAPYMDYILADAVVIPEGEERFYTETVLRLPDSYQINDSKRAVPPSPPLRSALGLPEDGFVFCHFNYSYKITPVMFAVWMRLLAGVPHSVLWLLETDPLFAQNVRDAAARAGVDPARLVFAPQLTMEEHVTRLAAGDLFLDSLPYGAHTSASDALWAGLPLLTCRGHTFSGRVGASLLTAMELPDLIAEDLAAYEAKALTLARDPLRLAAVKAWLKANRTSAPLFDTARTTRAIEAAYQQMFDRWQKGG